MQCLPALTIPAVDGGDVLSLLMADIWTAERRTEEIAVVNGHKAPELMMCFLRGHALATDYLQQVTTRLVKAQNVLAGRRAIVLLDIVPQILKEKGLISGRSPGGSEDQRNAVLELDAGYRQARDLVQELEAWQNVFKGKQKHLENCYLAVRKILGDSYSRNNPNTAFTQTTDTWEAARQTGYSTPPAVLIQQQPLRDDTIRGRSEEVPVAGTLRAAFGQVKD